MSHYDEVRERLLKEEFIKIFTTVDWGDVMDAMKFACGVKWKDEIADITATEMIAKIKEVEGRLCSECGAIDVPHCQCWNDE
jgi:hypothetical protein